MRTILKVVDGTKNNVQVKALVLVRRMVTRVLHVLFCLRCLFAQQYLLGRHWMRPMPCVVAVRTRGGMRGSMVRDRVG